MVEKYTELIPFVDDNGAHWIYVYEWIANNGSYYLGSCVKTKVSKKEYRKTQLALFYKNNEELIGMILNRLGFVIIESVFAIGGRTLWKTTQSGLRRLTHGTRNYTLTRKNNVIPMNSYRRRR